MRSILSRIGLGSFDPEHRELRMTAVTMAAVLASFGSVLLLVRGAGLGFDVVVESVVLTRVAARVSRTAGRTDRIAGVVVLPVATLVAAEIGDLMTSRPDLGDVCFVLGMATAIWARRFGPHWTKAGSLVVAPFIVNLILHGQDGPAVALTPPPWTALVALICYFWVFALQTLAARTGFGERPKRSIRVARVERTAGTRRKLAVSTRMALQMAASLGAAFIVGRLVWPTHWSWVVLTAYIVCSGARGRADVVFKGAMRAGGALVGTVVGLEIAGLFGPRSPISVVLIFVVLAAATWLRELNYAYWAAGVTTVLSLLYGWLGESSGSLLPIRLSGILVGAVIGVTASWLLMPVRTRDVLHRRSAEALAALGGLLTDDWQSAAELAQHRTSFDQRAERLEQIARPLRAHRRLLAGLRSRRNHEADAIDAIRRCAQPMGVIVRAAGDEHTLRADPDIAALADAVAANVTAVRRAIAGKPGDRYQAVTTAAQPTAKGPDGATRIQRQLVAALAEIDGELSNLSEIFATPSAGKP